MYAESMQLSPRWAAEYRGFWDLPEDFDFDVADPDASPIEHAAARARSPRRSPPTRSSPPSRGRPRKARRRAARRRRGRSLEAETLEALLDEQLTRARGQGDPVRLQGPRPLRQVGRGAAVARRLRRPDRAAVRRGAEHRRGRRRRARDPLRLRPRLLRLATDNWKLHAAIFVRDTDEPLREIYPAHGALRPRLDGAARVLLPVLRAGSSRSRRSPRATPSSTSSCPTSRASTTAGWGARCRTRRVPERATGFAQ